MLSKDKAERFAQTKHRLRMNIVDLAVVSQFVEDVYRLGIYAEPKAYARRYRQLRGPLHAALIRIAREAALLGHDPIRVRLAIELAEIDIDLDGHFWRAERIVEEMARRDATEQAQ